MNAEMGIKLGHLQSMLLFALLIFHRLWLPEPAAADRPCEIHRVVAVSVSSDWRGNRMGDVSVLVLKERHSGR